MEVISERENLLKTMLGEGLVLETPVNQAGQMKKVAFLWNINFNTGYTARPVSNSVTMVVILFCIYFTNFCTIIGPGHLVA